ncbi:hypothetical protein NDU88_008810 [Pleurodeles waltl]|uniref:Uncharacterized protein n=1 Tax=Pleurodeles waltl TaxID=8319 RepID=A0AAV7QT14_PLEWA|nr:hypothetical protein NDU88_008810 [Pleurodeles waltl]
MREDAITAKKASGSQEGFRRTGGFRPEQTFVAELRGRHLAFPGAREESGCMLPCSMQSSKEETEWGGGQGGSEWRCCHS